MIVENEFLQSMIFCEDLRVEVSGREIALGVYSGTATVPQIPFMISSFIVRFELHFFGQSVEKMFFRIDDPVGNRLFEQTVAISFVDWNKPGSLAVGIQNMILPIAGRYNFYLKFSGDWQLVRNLYVEKFDPAEMRHRLELQLRSLGKELPA